MERKSQLALEEKQIGKVDLFEPALEDNQFRLATEEVALKKSIATVDTGLSVENENIKDMNKNNNRIIQTDQVWSSNEISISLNFCNIIR